MTLWLALWGMHFLCDFPLQGDFLARGKNRLQPIPGVPWFWCMLAHSAIHGAGVALVFQNPALGVLEFIAHFTTDTLKCEGGFGESRLAFSIDQCVHLATKLLWLFLWLYV